MIDFAVPDDGKITVFELNSTFQISRSIPPEQLKAWDHLEKDNEEIVKALLAAITLRAAPLGDGTSSSSSEQVWSGLSL